MLRRDNVNETSGPVARAQLLDEDLVMADWSPLRAKLETVEDQFIISWGDLDQLVGGLPPSASAHAAFWSGQRSGWPGFAARAQVGHSVTFMRRTRAADQPQERAGRREPVSEGGDLILVGCVKSKLSHSAPARELYTSALFRKARTYAEESGRPWFVLSAKYGLVRPDDVIEPYEVYLPATTAGYRRHWGDQLLHQLRTAVGLLQDVVVEVHAGASYVAAVEGPLRQAGAEVLNPLVGLSMGRRLAWYRPHNGEDERTSARRVPQTVGDLVERLTDEHSAKRPEDLDREHLSAPGLYSWWVDATGAVELEAGLGHPVQPGLIYAGLAGATRARSGRASSNTLWGRIHGMHLGRRHSFSTFRRSLGAILASARHETSINEEALTDWMKAHLRVIALPVQDADQLDACESAILRQLDPPLNLAKVDKNPLRKRLSSLRRRHR